MVNNKSQNSKLILCLASFDWKQKKPRKISGLFLLLCYLDLWLLLCKILSKVGQNHFGSCPLDRKQHLVHAAVVV